MQLIESNINDIVAICKKFHVQTLSVFGSVLTDRFSNESDIDFVVDFADVDVADYADNYLGMHEALQNLFHRDIDLLENKAIRNSVLQNRIATTKQLIYG